MQVGIKFSTAIHALLCAKFFENEKVTSEFIAGSINTNPVIVRRLLSTLKAAGLVNVAAGVGGVSLAKEPKDINLLEIFNAVNEKEKLFKSTNCPRKRAKKRYFARLARRACKINLG